MKHIQTFLLAVTIMITTYNKADAAYWCNDKPVKVNVIIDTGQVIYDHSKSEREIAQRFHSVNGKQKGLSYHVAGLTEAVFKIESSMEAEIQTRANNKNEMCIVMTALNVYMGYGNIYVYVDKKFPVGSCEYDSILRHENAHVNIFQSFLAYYANYLRETVEYAAKQVHPVVVSSKDEVQQTQQKMLQSIQPYIMNAIKVYGKARDEENMRLDSNKNYSYTSALCDNW